MITYGSVRSDGSRQWGGGQADAPTEDQPSAASAFVATDCAPTLTPAPASKEKYASAWSLARYNPTKKIQES